MAKPKIFISHITEEAELAKELKQFIEKRFLKSVDVFASSHEESIKLGDDWMSAIKTSLDDSKLVIILSSPISILRPWVNFEAGAGWLKGVPVIPLCHSGLTPSQLSVPLNSFQGGLLSDVESIKKLFSRVAEILNLDAPDHEDKNFFSVMQAFESKVVNTAIIKDTVFVNNYLQRQIINLEYCIYASTLNYKEMSELKIFEWNLEKHAIEFNNMHNSFNLCLLQSVEHKTKVYQFLKETVDQLFSDLKFILSYQDLNIPPSIKELLNSFLFSSFKVNDWFHGLQLISNDSKAGDMLITMIKDEPLPIVRRDASNLIHYCFDYYEGLELYKEWLVNIKKEIGNLLAR